MGPAKTLVSFSTASTLPQRAVPITSLYGTFCAALVALITEPAVADLAFVPSAWQVEPAIAGVAE